MFNLITHDKPDLTDPQARHKCIVKYKNKKTILGDIMKKLIPSFFLLFTFIILFILFNCVTEPDDPIDPDIVFQRNFVSNSISFHSNGFLSSGTLISNTTVSNIHFRSNTAVSFYDDRKIYQGFFKHQSKHWQY